MGEVIDLPVEAASAFRRAHVTVMHSGCHDATISLSDRQCLIEVDWKSNKTSVIYRGPDEVLCLAPNRKQGPNIVVTIPLKFAQLWEDLPPSTVRKMVKRIRENLTPSQLAKMPRAFSTPHNPQGGE